MFTRDKYMDNFMEYSSNIVQWLIRRGKLRDAIKELRFHKEQIARGLVHLNGGQIIGIEAAAHASRPRWAAILPETGGKLVRIQYWDERGLMGHTCFNNEQEALDAFVQMGHLHYDKGSFSRMAQTQSFIEGMAQTEEIHRAFAAA